MRQWRDEQGAVAVEFAYLAPILILLLFGIVQFGLAMWRVSVIESAAREGARIAALGATDADVTDRVTAAAAGFLPAELTVTNTGCSAVGDDVTVTVTADSDRLDIDILFWGIQDQTYGAVATFRCERV